MWLSATLDTCISQKTGNTELFAVTYDVTDKNLEEQVFSNLPRLGFDVVGILYIKTHVCRYFRIKLMRPESLYENIENYDSSIGGDIDRIVLPDQRDSVREGLKVETIVSRLEREDVYPFTYSMKNRQGEILQKMLQFSYLDESRQTIFFCKSDITNQTESEHRQIEELNAAKLEAERANEAKSMFLSSMSHDLRTPLNGILCFAELALRTDDMSRRKDYLEKILLSGELLKALVNDTLEMSRIESGKYKLEPETVNMKKLTAAVITAVRPMAEEKKIKFILDTDDDLCETIWADRVKLQKIFLNILSNAIKYTPEGGIVTVVCGMLKEAHNDCNYRFSVSDTGIGMKPEFMEHLFEPFSQERRPEAANVTGTGLGLSIVKRIIDLMHGHIYVTSAIGKGSCFTVELPLQETDDIVNAAAVSKADISVLCGKNVLFIEDNYLNIEIGTILLKDAGVSVTCAVNGKEGLDRFLASDEGFYDAVLTDIRMPVMDGFGFVNELRKLERNDAVKIPVIAMTADVFDDDVRRYSEAGMSGCVTKPVNSEELYEILADKITIYRDL